MPTVIDSLLVRLGFSTDPKGLEGFAKMADQAKGMALGVVGAVTGAVYGIEHMVKSAAERMGGIQDFSERVNMSARDVAAFGRVAAEHDSSLEGMEGTISSLNAIVGQAASGFPRATMMLGRFGLKAKDAHGNAKSFNEIMGDVIQKMQTAGTGKTLAMANALGIDPKLIPLLREGVDNWNELREKALASNPFAEGDYENAEKTDKLFQKAEATFTRFKDRLAVGLLPTVNEILRKFTAWVSDSKNIAKIQGYINDVVRVAKLLWENAEKIGAVFAIIYAHKFGAMFLEWGVRLVAVAKGMTTAAGAQAMLNAGLGGMRTILTGGILGLLLLMAEDLWVFYRGGTSVTGWLLTKFPYAVEVAQGAIALLSGSLVALTTGSGPLGLLIVGIGGLVIAANSLREAWNPVSQWWNEMWDGMFNYIADLYNALPAPVRGLLHLLDGGGFDMGEASKDVFKNSEASDLRLTRDMANWKPMSTDDSGPPAWLQKGGSTSTRSQVNHVDSSIRIGEVHVHEAKSGAETWERVQKAAREQARNGQPGVR